MITVAGLLRIDSLDINTVIERIENGDTVRLARYGDAEFEVMSGAWGSRKQSSQGQPYGPQVCEMLRKTVANDQIMHGIYFTVIDWLVHRNYSWEKVTEWIGTRKLKPAWVEASFLTEAAMSGHLRPFVDCLRSKRTVIVGPSHLSSLEGIDHDGFVECSHPRAILEVEAIKRTARWAIETAEAEVVTFSAGFASNVLISDLSDEYPDVHLIDVGSLWDMFTERRGSRTWVRALSEEDHAELVRRNLGLVGAHE